MGLVNKVVPVASLEEEGVSWAKEILQKSPLSIRLLKSAFNAELDGQAGIQELAGQRDAALLHERGGEGVPLGPEVQEETRREEVSLAALKPAAAIQRSAAIRSAVWAGSMLAVSRTRRAPATTGESKVPPARSLR